MLVLPPPCRLRYDAIDDAQLRHAAPCHDADAIAAMPLRALMPAAMLLSRAPPITPYYAITPCFTPMPFAADAMLFCAIADGDAADAATMPLLMPHC